MNNLCICHWGHSRSVALARLLHSKNQAAVAIGFASNGGAIGPLSEWADRIFVLQADYAQYVPAGQRHKVVIFDVGPDVWVNPYHQGLRDILERMYAEHEAALESGQTCPGCFLDHPAPAFEHRDGCPYKVSFYGGDPAWMPREGERTGPDGRRWRWGSPGTWVPIPDAEHEAKTTCHWSDLVGIGDWKLIKNQDTPEGPTP